MKIILIRHAETNANALGLAQGSGSTEPLNEAGMAQAGALTALLSEEPIDAIYSSPALRAVQTVSGLAESTGITVQALPELAERNWGNWNMRIWKEVQEGLASLDPIERYTFAPRGGESEEELEQRLRKVADRFATL
ncbi:MAG: histidine phosphatase family protein, partial [Patescibacteria group bacterium]|nr:histidine phosphatase family protein [Patescibacteria group bacterium]